jgi:hypothetical protein
MVKLKKRSEIKVLAGFRVFKFYKDVMGRGTNCIKISYKSNGKRARCEKKKKNSSPQAGKKKISDLRGAMCNRKKLKKRGRVRTRFDW